MLMKHLKHLKYTLIACAFSATSSCCLSKSRLVDVELDATEVTSAELIGGVELASNTRLAGGSTRRTQDDAWMSAARSSLATRGSPATAHAELAGGA
jgi:hypothetical protein